jgi:glutamate racemase
MDNRPIGFLDSGVGGLSILAEVARLLPAERLVYVGDSAHFPYGAIEPRALRELTGELTRFLLALDAKLLVVACNTATVYALDALREAFPGLPFVGVVPVVKVLAEQSRSGSIGLLSTPNTARSAYLADLVGRFAAGKTVINVPCEGLADLVEAGQLDGPPMDRLLQGILSPLIAGAVDVVGLGCTHYPFARPRIQALLDKSVRIYDSGLPVARRVQSVLARSGGLAAPQAPDCRLYTTGDPLLVDAVTTRLPGLPPHGPVRAAEGLRCLG